MGRNFTSIRPILGETLCALLVLALVFLNFGHVAPSLGSDYGIESGSSFCGAPLSPDESGHLPCHACRVGGGADLPPGPVAVEPVTFAMTVIGYDNIVPLGLAPPVQRAAQPRAPPVA